MKNLYPCLLTVLLFTLIVVPASAFTAEKLVINVMDNGDAQVTFDYELSWPELISFSLVPQKEQIIQSAIKSKFTAATVDTISVSTTGTGLAIRNFAQRSDSAGVITYKTPAISFMIAKDLLNNYPLIANTISPDFSPEETIVKFPGGRQYTYHEASGIPAITCTVQ